MKNEINDFERSVDLGSQRDLSGIDLFDIICNKTKKSFLKIVQERIKRIIYNNSPLENPVRNYKLLSPWPTGRGPIEAPLFDHDILL